MQKSNVCDIEFDMVLSAALTCVAEGLDSKEVVKTEIRDYVYNHYRNAEEINDIANIPVGVLELLHEKFGVEFQFNDGKLAGINIPVQNNGGI